MEQKKSILTVTRAAEMCNVTRATIWRWIKTGKLRAAATAGGHHRIHSDDLIKFMKKNKMDIRIRGDNGLKRILIVDDDQKITKLLRKVFSGTDYEVENASDGFEAGIKTIRFRPHLVILDLFMPKIDGFEVCRRLKKDKDTVHTKIIAISGFNTEENRQRILNCGADLFVAKPLDIKKIKEEAGRMLTLDG